MKTDNSLLTVVHKDDYSEVENCFLQLRFVGVGARVGHAQNPPARMRQVGSELVFERFSPERLPT